MLDKIIYVSKNEIVLIFTHRAPFRLTSDDGTAVSLLEEFLVPRNNAGIRTVSEWHRAQMMSQEDTVIIDTDEVA